MKRVSAKRWREEIRGGSNYLQLPEGVKFFLGKPGTYRLDFMSYIAGKGNPRAEEGEAYFERTFFVHQGVGPNQDWYLCPARTMKKPCPICEHRSKLSADPEGDEQLIKSLAPKERQLWIVKDLLNDPDSILIWEVSYHLFGRALKDKINNADEEDGYDFFADPVDGFTLRVALQQSDRGKWTETADIEFRPRKQKYDPEIVEEMPCLDDMIVATPYDKLKAVFLQTDEDQEDVEDEGFEEKEKKRRSPKSKALDESVAEEKEERSSRKKTRRCELSAGDEVWYKGERCEVLRVSGDGTSLTLEDSEGEILKAVDFEDVEMEEAKEPSKAEREEVDDDWDDWDDGPEQKKRKGTSSKRRAEEEKDESKPKPKRSKKVDDDWDDWD